MSAKLPPEIDRMLWSVAESNDPRAIEEMGDRYPAFRGELTARIHMVRSLKGSRPTHEVPRFSLPQPVPTPWYVRPVALVSAGALLATLALATVVTVSSRRTTKLPPVQPINVEKPVQAVKKPDEQGVPSDTLNTPKIKPQDVAPVNEPTLPWDTLVTFETDGMSLKEAIKQIAAQGGLTVDFAPGLSAERVAATYTAVTVTEALADLGQNFGFTALPEGERKILIVPATDPARPPVNLPESSHSESIGNSKNEQSVGDAHIVPKN